MLYLPQGGCTLIPPNMGAAKNANMNDDPKPLPASSTTEKPAQTLTSVAAEQVLTRRKLARAGLGAPVLLTLMSKPAFGAACLSNMLSGNLSDPNRGNCSGGWSPGGWMNPGGMIHTYRTLDAWVKAGAFYGTYSGSGNANQGENYTGGTLFTATGFTVPSGAPSTITIREVLLNYSGSLQFHLAAGWLNANLSANDPTFQYIVTPAQLLGLANGTIPIPPPYLTLQEFLDKNYHVV